MCGILQTVAFIWCCVTLSRCQDILFDDLMTQDTSQWTFVSGAANIATFTTGGETKCPNSKAYCWKLKSAATAHTTTPIVTAGYTDVTLNYELLNAQPQGSDVCTLSYSVSSAGGAWTQINTYPAGSGDDTLFSETYNGWAADVTNDSNGFYLQIEGLGTPECSINDVQITANAIPTTPADSTATPTKPTTANSNPTTAAPTSVTGKPTAAAHTADPTTADPTTADPTNTPTTNTPTTADPTTADPTTADPTTADPSTADPTTAAPTTADPTTADPTTADPTTADPTTANPTTAELTAAIRMTEETAPLLSIEWWIVIGVGGLCLVTGVCAMITSVLRKQPSVVNNYNDNRGAQIAMAGTAAVEKKTGADRDAGEFEEEKALLPFATAADAIVVKNALVLSVGVSEYNTLDNLPGVISDVENHRHLWKNVYNYRVIPDKDDYDAQKWFDKKYWTYDDVEEFIMEKRDEMFDHDDNLLYDALIITLNGHGATSGILPSDYDANDKKNCLPVQYSFLQMQVDGNWNAQVSTIPRIFVIDACRGPSDNAAARPDEASQARGNPGTVHKDALTCMLYGNSPGYKVREHAARGGNFSQCLISELKKTNDASTSPPLSIVTSRTSKTLKRKSDKEQTCWLEGDPQCNNVVFVRKK